MKLTLKCLAGLLLASLAVMSAGAAEKKDMPKKDVVEVPAIGQGLCVANAFQHGAPAWQAAEHLGLGRAGRGGLRCVRWEAGPDHVGSRPVVASNA